MTAVLEIRLSIDTNDYESPKQNSYPPPKEHSLLLLIFQDDNLQAVGIRILRINVASKSAPLALKPECRPQNPERSNQLNTP
ncbi:hypothetical protein HPG69_015774 [Diceros bicornis minor]|uniref:Uncharacterized protein n=1 Tax=Diceros bicornis minor TaxID=77932 RepID=A0A7J7E8S2_DICBM|nr:hypothetical protein HPG69_015774 [Diceros bicornis minor]